MMLGSRTNTPCPISQTAALSLGLCLSTHAWRQLPRCGHGFNHPTHPQGAHRQVRDHLLVGELIPVGALDHTCGRVCKPGLHLSKPYQQHRTRSWQALRLSIVLVQPELLHGHGSLTIEQEHSAERLCLHHSHVLHHAMHARAHVASASRPLIYETCSIVPSVASKRDAPQLAAHAYLEIAPPLVQHLIHLERHALPRPQG